MNLMKLRLHHKTIPTVLTFSLITAAFSYSSYIYGFNQVNRTRQPISSISETSKAVRIGPKSIVKSQQALALGEVIAKNDSSVTVKGNDGQQSSFQLSPKLTVMDIASGSGKVKPSGDKEKILLNRRAIITLDFQDTDYLVTDITFISN